MLAELASERRWDELFAASAGVLGDLAKEALAEYRAGRTKLLDPDTSWSRTRPRSFDVLLVTKDMPGYLW